MFYNPHRISYTVKEKEKKTRQMFPKIRYRTGCNKTCSG